MSYSPQDIRDGVRSRYAEKARTGNSAATCCGAGYSIDQLHSIPDGADLGLGCGIPTLTAELSAGETALDLGSGAGADCFIAARAVGPGGRVIGVDMTPEMLERARGYAAAGGYDNVEFLEGQIEALPVQDASVDVVISNCVVNLSPHKEAVFAEAYRVLRPGGRMAISDLVATREMTHEERENLDLYSACISGAIRSSEIRALLAQAGFAEIDIEMRDDAAAWETSDGPAQPVVSATIRARKPLT